MTSELRRGLFGKDGSFRRKITAGQTRPIVVSITDIAGTAKHSSKPEEVTPTRYSTSGPEFVSQSGESKTEKPKMDLATAQGILHKIRETHEDTLLEQPEPERFAGHTTDEIQTAVETQVDALMQEHHARIMPYGKTDAPPTTLITKDTTHGSMALFKGFGMGKYVRLDLLQELEGREGIPLKLIEFRFPLDSDPQNFIRYTNKYSKQFEHSSLTASTTTEETMTYARAVRWLADALLDWNTKEGKNPHIRLPKHLS